MNKGTFSYKAILAAVLSGGIFVYALYRLDPRTSGMNVTLFLVSLFIVAMSVFALLNYLVIRMRSNNESHFLASRGSLRRGFLVGIYVVGVLGLSALELLTWWDALLLALSLVLFELYFISGKEKTS